MISMEVNGSAMAQSQQQQQQMQHQQQQQNQMMHNMSDENKKKSESQRWLEYFFLSLIVDKEKQSTVIHIFVKRRYIYKTGSRHLYEGKKNTLPLLVRTPPPPYAVTQQKKKLNNKFVAVENAPSAI